MSQPGQDGDWLPLAPVVEPRSVNFFLGFGSERGPGCFGNLDDAGLRGVSRRNLRSCLMSHRYFSIPIVAMRGTSAPLHQHRNGSLEGSAHKEGRGERTFVCVCLSFCLLCFCSLSYHLSLPLIPPHFTCTLHDDDPPPHHRSLRPTNSSDALFLL